MNSDDPPDERVIYRERFQGVYFDFRGKSIFTRYDRCEFVKCTLLIDHSTEQLAFTACVFKDCNIDKLQPDEARGLYVMDNFFYARWMSGALNSKLGWPKHWPRGRRRENERTTSDRSEAGIAEQYADRKHPTSQTPTTPAARPPP
jgi:hypothetical protein